MFPTAIFTPESLAWVIYDLQDTIFTTPQGKSELSFSFRVRTTESRAFLFFVGDKSLGADSMFFLVRIVDGHVTIRLRPDLSLTSVDTVNDGVWHYVRGAVTDEVVSISIDGKSEDSIPLNGSISVRSEFAFVGGLPDVVTMVLKQSTDNGRKSILDRPFHGDLQDLRLNEIFFFIDPIDKERFDTQSWLDMYQSQHGQSAIIKGKLDVPKAQILMSLN